MQWLKAGKWESSQTGNYNFYFLTIANCYLYFKERLSAADKWLQQSSF